MLTEFGRISVARVANWGAGRGVAQTVATGTVGAIWSTPCRSCPAAVCRAATEPRFAPGLDVEAGDSTSAAVWGTRNRAAGETVES